MNDFLTTQQAADLAGVDRETIIRAAKDGKLPHDHRFGVYAFQKSDVLDVYGLTVNQAAELYSELTGHTLNNPYQLVGNMERRGFAIGRSDGRIRLNAADVRAYAKDKLERPRLPSPQPTAVRTAKGVLTPATALTLFKTITGASIANPGTIVSGMERRGFPVQRDKRGRITMREADVRAYIADKIERPNLRKAGKSITISPPPAARNGRVRSTIEAVREAAEGQGYKVVQRRGYVELLRGPRFRPVEPEFVDIEFIPTGTGVQAQW